MAPFTVFLERTTQAAHASVNAERQMKAACSMAGTA
jgi:hypothetical protein